MKPKKQCENKTFSFCLMTLKQCHYSRKKDNCSLHRLDAIMFHATSHCSGCSSMNLFMPFHLTEQRSNKVEITSRQPNPLIPTGTKIIQYWTRTKRRKINKPLTSGALSSHFMLSPLHPHVASAQLACGANQRTTHVHSSGRRPCSASHRHLILHLCNSPNARRLLSPIVSPVCVCVCMELLKF